MIALLLCMALCVTVLCACKKEEPVDPKTLIPQHTVPAEGANGEYKVSESWELNENITCMEFTERNVIEIIMEDGSLKVFSSISMWYVDDAKNPRYELVLNDRAGNETLFCTVTKDGTKFEDGIKHYLYFSMERTVSWGFYSWLTANAKTIEF